MVFKLIPRLLTLSFVLCVWSISAFAQGAEARPRVIANNTEFNDISCSPEELVVVASTTANAEGPRTAKPTIGLPGLVEPKVPESLKYQPLLLAAIDQRLGSRYRWGATGPDRFDCSGFVWSIFQSVGINFERGSARTLWTRFAPAAPEEQYKFGTLVFFSGLAHVGVVADANGFYHASRRHGVIYSQFNEYWVKRIDGFRRVPLPALQITD
jgi:cell wall-associated NlpC family hydrolase